MQKREEISRLESLPHDILTEILGYSTLETYFNVNQASQFLHTFQLPDPFWKRKYRQIVAFNYGNHFPTWKEAFFTNFKLYDHESDKRENIITTIIKDDNLRLLTKLTIGMNKKQFLEYIILPDEKELNQTLYYAQKFHCNDILNHIYQVVTVNWLDPHALDSDGKSILYWAVNCNQSYALIEDFIKKGVPYTEFDPSLVENGIPLGLDDVSNYASIMQVAIRREDPAIIQLFWEKLLKKVSQALYIALSDQEHLKESIFQQIAGYLLEANALDMDLFGDFLVDAASYGYQPIVKMLLDFIKDSNFDDHNIYRAYVMGICRAYVMAAEKGHVGILKQLCKTAVNLNVQCQFNESPLYKAVENYKLPAVVYLLKKGGIPQAPVGENTLLQVAMALHPDTDSGRVHYQSKMTTAAQTRKKNKMVHAWREIVKVLLKYDLESINKTDRYGNTLLCTAALLGDVALLDHLLKKKADANHMTFSGSIGNKALDMAIANNHQKAAELLLVHTSLENDCHSLYLALEADSVDTVKLLLERSPEALFVMRNFERPVLLAWEKNATCLPLVLQSMSKTEDMMPLLFMATEASRVDIVKQILAMDASKINSQYNPSDGKFLLHIAAAGGSSEIVVMLLKAGSNPFLIIVGAAANMTAREVARQHGHQDIYQILFDAETELLQRRAGFFHPVLPKRKGEDGDDYGNAKRPRI